MTMRSSINLLKYLLLFLILFAGGKNYAQESQRTDASGNCYGRTTLGAIPTSGNRKGLQVILSSAGNMQVVKNYYLNDLGGYYSNVIKGAFAAGGGDRLTFATTYPYVTPGLQHGLVVSIGNTYYYGGNLIPSTADRQTFNDGGKFILQSQTCQNLIGNPYGTNQTNELKFKVTKNNKDYLFTLKYIYNYPDTKFDLIYSVQIPQGNTEEVKLAHGWQLDSFGADILSGEYKSGAQPVLSIRTKERYFQGRFNAIKYNSGIPWSGYYADGADKVSESIVNMIFNKSVPPQISSPANDAGLGISMNYGSTPGTYSTSTTQIYDCPADNIKPNVTPQAAVCNLMNVNLFNYIITSPPSNLKLVFIKVSDVNATTGTIIDNPENYNPGTPGTHYFKAYLVSDEFGCSGPLSDAITINFDTSSTLCSKCYSNPLTTGTVVKPVTGISNLVKTTTAKTWLDNFSGAQLVTESKTNGFVLNRLTTAQITALQNPVEGMVVYDTTTNELKVYNTATSPGANGVSVSTTGWKVFKNQYCPN